MIELASKLPLHQRTTEFVIELCKAQKPYRRILYRHEPGMMCLPPIEGVKVHLYKHVFACPYIVKFFPGGDPAMRIHLQTRYFDSKRDLDELADAMIEQHGWFE